LFALTRVFEGLVGEGHETLRSSAQTERLVQMSASARRLEDDGQRHTVTVRASEGLAWLDRDFERAIGARGSPAYSSSS
jgi:hypothetical protein